MTLWSPTVKLWLCARWGEINKYVLVWRDGSVRYFSLTGLSSLHCGYLCHGPGETCRSETEIVSPNGKVLHLHFRLKISTQNEHARMSFSCDTKSFSSEMVLFGVTPSSRPKSRELDGRPPS